MNGEMKYKITEGEVSTRSVKLEHEYDQGNIKIEAEVSNGYIRTFVVTWTEKIEHDVYTPESLRLPFETIDAIRAFESRIYGRPFDRDAKLEWLVDFAKLFFEKGVIAMPSLTEEEREIYDSVKRLINPD